MAKPTFVKCARKDIPNASIKAGESYYWWKFRFGGKHYSKTKPSRSQLTQSDFYAQIFDIEDNTIGEAAADDSLASTRDDVVSQLEDLKSECEEKLENMPDNLRESSSSGELLQERVDALESAISEFEGLELDEPGEDELDIEREENETDEDFEAKKETAIEEYWQSKLEEFQNVCIDAP